MQITGPSLAVGPHDLRDAVLDRVEQRLLQVRSSIA
jgi:hypothetical protein